jgi:hypothetical protein
VKKRKRENSAYACVLGLRCLKVGFVFSLVLRLFFLVLGRYGLLLVLRLVCLVERLFSPVPGRYGLSLAVL